MKNLIPLILELDEPLEEGEQMIDIKTIGIPDGQGRNLIGYVAVIRDTRKRLEVRMGNLKATPYTQGKMSKYVI